MADVWQIEEVLPFSAPDRPSGCGSRRVRNLRRVWKCPQADDLQGSPPSPAVTQRRCQEEEEKKSSGIFHCCVLPGKKIPCGRTAHQQVWWASWPVSSCWWSAEECVGWRWCRTAWTSPGSHWRLKAGGCKMSLFNPAAFFFFSEDWKSQDKVHACKWIAF